MGGHSGVRGLGHHGALDPFFGQGAKNGGHSGVNLHLLERRVFGLFGPKRPLQFTLCEFGGQIWAKNSVLSFWAKLCDMRGWFSSLWAQGLDPRLTRAKWVTPEPGRLFRLFGQKSLLARVASGFLGKFSRRWTDGVFSVGPNSIDMEGQTGHSCFWDGQKWSSKNRGSGFLLPGVILVLAKRGFLALFWPYSDAFFKSVFLVIFGDFSSLERSLFDFFAFFGQKVTPTHYKKRALLGPIFGF